jgi:hypothetical protein
MEWLAVCYRWDYLGEKRSGDAELLIIKNFRGIDDSK